MTVYEILALPLNIEDKARYVSQGATYRDAAIAKLSSEFSEEKKKFYTSFFKQNEQEWNTQYELIWDSYYTAIGVANEKLQTNQNWSSDFIALDKFNATSIAELKATDIKVILLQQETNFKLWKTLLTLLEKND